MATWFHVNDSTGAIATGGVASDTNAELQVAPSGHTLVILPDGLVDRAFDSAPDFTRLKEYLRGKIDREAGQFRVQFITDVPGQAQSYEKKEAEARLWVAGDETTNPDRYPFMIAEATLRGVAVSVVRGEIMTQVNMLTPLAAATEAHRVAAKLAIASATNLGAIVTAATVDWEALLP